MRGVSRITIVAFLLTGVLLTATAKPVYFVTPCRCQNNHGEDRWAAKTEWVAVPTQASKFKRVQPSDMYRWKPLPGLDSESRRQPQEEQWYKVTGRVVDVRVQADGDIHFELEDINGIKKGHILAEVPVGRQWCDLRKIVFSWTTKRMQFNRFQAPRQLTLRSQKLVVTVLGKAFFDTHHAKKNPLLNISNNNKSGILAAWEIHPVSGFTADSSVLPLK
jgi:hypothetical protein